MLDSRLRGNDVGGCGNDGVVVGMTGAAHGEMTWPGWTSLRLQAEIPAYAGMT